MDICMTMPVGGPHKVGPGQVTEDSELAMCLMWGLIEGNTNVKRDFFEELNLLPTQKIAEYYGKWMKSKPFDNNEVLRNAFEPLINHSIPQLAKKRAH